MDQTTPKRTKLKTKQTRGLREKCLGNVSSSDVIRCRVESTTKRHLLNALPFTAVTLSFTQLTH